MANQVGVLGPIRIQADDRSEIDTGGKRQRRLLAALAVSCGDVVSVDSLVDIVFDGNPTEAAERTLQTYVSRLRRAVDNGAGDDGTAIDRVGAGYVLRLEPHDLDSAEFELRLREARGLAATGDHAGAVRGFDAALRSWRGTPYGEFADEEWAIAECQRLLELHAAAIEDRADSQLALGGHAEVVADLERFTREEQTRERPRAQLMLALYRSGRQADALRVYQDYFNLLRDEMGLEPSRALRELESRIIAGDPSLDVEATGGTALRGYQLFEELGRGAFSLVHRGTQPSVGRDVAVKVIRSELANEADFIRRFETEAHMVANLEHPHVVPLYDFWREPDNAYLVMELLKGRTLKERIESGPLSKEELLETAVQIADALATAHAEGIVHRDIKPANIFCDDEGNFYLGDFGIAIGDTVAHEVPATVAPAYASPELLEHRDVGPTADIYSLGTTIFEALTGTAPFADSASDEELIRRQLHEPLPLASSLRGGIPTAVEEVVQRATAKSTVGRYSSARELVAAFLRAVETAAGGAPRPVAPTAPAAEPGPNPYKGLRAFREADAGDFFGRTALTAELLALLRSDGPAGRLVTVVGPSGSGKSSVVRAGLVPAVREGGVPGSDSWFVATTMPGASPYAELEAALLRIAVNPPATLLDQLRSGPDGIDRAVKRVLPDETSELLLVVDQFEELFTVATDPAESARFIDALLAAVDDPHSRLRVVCTLRADFYDRPLRDPRIAERIKESTVVVTPMTADEVAEAISLPARRAGAVIDEGLVARITADVVDQPGSLPLLQYALAELYDHGAGTLSHGLYDQMGGVTAALAGQAERIFSTLDEDGREGTRLLFTRLVTLGEDAEDTRRRVSQAELAGVGPIGSALRAYESSRLLTFDRDGESREPTVEVAHEALIREWPRYQDWVEDDRDGLRIHRHLTASAQAWMARGEDDGDLYRGARLEAAQTWAGQHPGETNELEDRFLTESHRLRLAEDVRALRQRRRLQRSLAAVAVVALVATIAGVLAFREQHRAERQRDTADKLRAVAEFNELIAEGLAARDPGLTVLLALEADSLRPGSPEALNTLAQGLLAQAGRTTELQASWVASTGIPDRFITFDSEVVQVRSATEPSLIVSAIPVTASTVAPTPSAMSPGRTRLAQASGDGFAIIDLAEELVGPVAGERDENGAFSTTAWTANDLLVVGDDPMVVYRVDGLELSFLAEVPRPQQSLPPFMSAHPTEPRLAVVNGGGVEIWDTLALAEGTLKVVERYDHTEFGWPRPPILNLEYSPDGSRLYAWNLLDLGMDVWQIHENQGPRRLPLQLADFGGGSVRELSTGELFVGGSSRAAVASPSGVILNEWMFSGGLTPFSPTELPDGRLAVAQLTGPPPPPGCPGCKVQILERDTSLPTTSLLPEFSELAAGETVSWFPEEGIATVMTPVVGGQAQLHEIQVAEIWDLSGDEPEQVHLAGDPDYRALRVSPTDRGLLAAGLEGDTTIRVHDGRTGEMLYELAVDHPGLYMKLQVSHDGSTLRVFDNTNRIMTVYDLATGNEIVSRFFDSNGTWIVYDEDEGSGILTSSGGSERFDLATLETLERFDAAFWLPDSEGTRASHRRGADLVVENLTTGDRSTIASSLNLIPTVDPTGDFVIGWDARSPQGRLQWYHVASGLPIGPTVDGPVNDQHVEGTALTQVIDGRVHVWNDDPSSWWDLACDFAGRTLTEEEWEQYLPADMEYDPACA